MNKSILIFFILVSQLFVQQVLAQNPKRTVKISSEARNRARQSSDIKREYAPLGKDSDNDGILDINDK